MHPVSHLHSVPRLQTCLDTDTTQRKPAGMAAFPIFLSCLFYVLLFAISHVDATALTTAIGPNERLCFYADVDKAGEKIGVSCIAA